MKKILTIVVVLAILAVVVVPGAVGFFIEGEMDKQAAMAQQVQPGVEVETTGFSRGWFGSTVVQEYRLDAGPDMTAGVAAVFPGGVTLIVDSEVSHGLALLSGGPALAVATSRVTVDGRDGETWPLPGEVVTRIDFTGGGVARYTTSEFTIPEGAGGGSVNFGDTDISMGFNRDFSATKGGGRIESLSASSREGSVDIGPIEIDFDMSQSARYGLWTGDQALAFEGLRFREGPGGPEGEINGVSMRSSAGIDDDLMKASAEITIADVSVGGIVADDFRVAVVFDRVDAPSIAALQLASEQIQQMSGDQDDPATANPAMVESMMMEPLMNLVRRGPHVTVEELKVQLPQGPVNMNLDIALQEMPADSMVDPISVLNGMVGDGRLVIGKPVADLLARFNPETAGQIQMGLAMGFLIDTGENYEMDLKYQGGLLTVNGNPMPLPLNEMFGQ